MDDSEMLQYMLLGASHNWFCLWELMSVGGQRRHFSFLLFYCSLIFILCPPFWIMISPSLVCTANRLFLQPTEDYIVLFLYLYSTVLTMRSAAPWAVGWPWHKIWTTTPPYLTTIKLLEITEDRKCSSLFVYSIQHASHHYSGITITPWYWYRRNLQAQMIRIFFAAVNIL